jgi:vacuolar-type H+-ATPase subunit I/STV1
LKKLSEERKKELAKLREQKSVSGRRGEVERKLSELSSYKHKLPKEREEELASVRGQTSISERAEELQKKLHFR